MNDVQNDLMKNIGDGGSESKMRKYLIMGGGVFVIFAVGIVIAKFAFSSPTQDTEVILPPEIKTPVKTKKDDNTLFNNLPIEGSQNSKPKENKIIEKVETKTEKKEFKKPVIEDIEEKKELPIEPVKEVKKIEKTPNKPVIKTEKIEPVKVKKVVEKPKKESIKKVVKTTTKNYSYFIQVAAVTRGEPSKKFLKLIEKNKFHYKIQSVEIKGVKVKRVLIGGFETLKEAKAVLPKVKQKLSSSAFIKKLK